MPVELLDYPKANIRMIVETDFEKRMRINAAAKEPETVAWIDEYVKPGDSFFDIGANVGSYAFMAAARGAKVYAFEPEAMNFVRLCQNILLNADLSVIPIPLGFSEKCQVVPMYLTAQVPGAASHRYVKPEVKGNGRVLSQMVTLITMDVLDSFDIQTPAHMKIDVDGYEEEVLTGGYYMLQDPPLKTIMVEIDHDKPKAVEHILEIMKASAFVEKESWQRSNNIRNHLWVR